MATLLAPAVQVNDVIEVRIACFEGATGQLSLNTSHYNVASVSVPNIVTLTDIAQNLDNYWAADYKAVLCIGATYYGTAARILRPVGRKSLTWGYIGNTGLGAVGTPLLPKQTCGMFTRQTGVAGPGGRGRLYIAFPASGDNEAPGRPTAGYMVNLGVLAGKLTNSRAIVVGGATVNIDPILFHVSSPATITLVQGATARRKWATHRTRGDYGRVNTLPQWNL